MSMSDVKKIIEAIYNTGGCIQRPGYYNLERSKAERCVYEALNGRKNIFRDVDQVEHALWDMKTGIDYSTGQPVMYFTEEAMKLEALVNDPVILELFGPLDQLELFICQSHQRYLNYISYEQRRKRENSAIQNKQLRKRIFSKYEHKCASCGSEKDLSIDHILPVKHGGTSEEENLQVLCVSCNSSKGDKHEMV